MELERGDLVSPAPEVPVIDGEIVAPIRELAGRGWGSRAIARELEIARSTYLARATILSGVCDHRGGPAEGDVAEKAFRLVCRERAIPRRGE